jgi:hypothetical protein
MGYRIPLETMSLEWWRDPPKYEPPEIAWVNYVLPEVLQRVQAIETHLAEGAKTPFVQASNRFAGGRLDTSEILHGLHSRLEAIEKAVGAKAGK